MLDYNRTPVRFQIALCWGYRFVSPYAPTDHPVSKVITILWFALPIMLSITPIIIGSMYFHGCVLQPYLSVYLVVSGVTLLYFAISWIPLLCVKTEYQQVDPQAPPSFRPLRIFNSVVYTFMAAWVLAGCLWVFSVEKPEFHDIRSPKYCNELLYHFTFYFTIVMIAVITLLLPAIYFAFIRKLLTGHDF